MPNALFLRKDGKYLGDLPNAKAFTLALKLGDSATIRGGGGGGYGDPTEREAEKVREDVYQGYVSLGAARDTYGVVLDAETLAIDMCRDAEAAGGDQVSEVNFPLRACGEREGAHREAMGRVRCASVARFTAERITNLTLPSPPSRAEREF